MIILVTGCRSGFGYGIALLAAQQGHTVYAGFRDITTADALINASTELKITPIQLDVSNDEDINAAISLIEKEYGYLDVLVNNAGVSLGGFAEQLEEKELRDVFDINFFSVWKLSKLCLPLLRKSVEPKKIITISSMAGKMAFPGLGAYASSKFAVEGISESMRHELKPEGIDVVLVEPGAYKTDIFERNLKLCKNAMDTSHPNYQRSKNMEMWFTEKSKKIARDPKEIVNLVVSLLNKKKTKFRYPLGPGVKLRSFLLTFTPFRLIEFILSKAIS